MEHVISWMLVILGFLGLIFVLSFINALFVTLLWNWIIPILLPEGPLVATITYWQAWGLSLLCAFLIPRGWNASSKS